MKGKIKYLVMIIVSLVVIYSPLGDFADLVIFGYSGPKMETRPYGAAVHMSSVTPGSWSLTFSESWSQFLGQKLYYIVEVEDAAGNVAVSAEQSQPIKASNVPWLLFGK